MFSLRNVHISTEMLGIIAQIDEFKGSWNAYLRSPEKLSSLKKVATIESIGSSNRIEGNQLVKRGIWLEWHISSNSLSMDLSLSRLSFILLSSISKYKAFNLISLFTSFLIFSPIKFIKFLWLLLFIFIIFEKKQYVQKNLIPW